MVAGGVFVHDQKPHQKTLHPQSMKGWHAVKSAPSPQLPSIRIPPTSEAGKIAGTKNNK